jgi:hypothetical protein
MLGKARITGLCNGKPFTAQMFNVQMARGKAKTWRPIRRPASGLNKQRQHRRRHPRACHPGS